MKYEITCMYLKQSLTHNKYVCFYFIISLIKFFVALLLSKLCYAIFLK